MNSELTLASYIATFVPQVEDEIRRHVQAVRPAAFMTMLNYHLGFADATGTPVQALSGKRIRPVLTLLACAACGGDPRHALPAAAAVELLHNFSLIHDDIEDRDEMRRGRPTLWKLWGEAQAINSGDGMFAMAHQALEHSTGRGVDPARVLHALRTFDETALALTGGQHLDLSFEERTDVTADQYMAMIAGKTAALTRAACEIGAIIAGAPHERAAALADFGHWLGIAFQLQDDVLGIWGDPALTGKQDSDLSHGKKTLPVLYAAERDPRIREKYLERTHAGEADVDVVRSLIEACGAREFTERAAHESYARCLNALESAHIAGPAKMALLELAHSLLGRAA
jgi:geranylgeranyl diphosphate synthase, type I